MTFDNQRFPDVSLTSFAQLRPTMQQHHRRCISGQHSACRHHSCASAGAYDPAAAPHMAGPYDPTPQMPYQAVYEPQPAMAYAPPPAAGLLTTEPDGSNRIQLAIVGPQVGAVLGRNGANISQIRAVRLTVGCLWLWAVGLGCCVLPAKLLADLSPVPKQATVPCCSSAVFSFAAEVTCAAVGTPFEVEAVTTNRVMYSAHSVMLGLTFWCNKLRRKRATSLHVNCLGTSGVSLLQLTSDICTLHTCWPHLHTRQERSVNTTITLVCHRQPSRLPDLDVLSNITES